MPLVDEASGKVTARICHIKAQSLRGPRFDAEQTEKKRHGFDNLVLMCPIHHDVIDADENSETYNQVLATIGTGSSTNCVTIKPDGSLIYIGTEDGYIVIDPLSYAVVARIGTGSATQSLTIKPDGVLMFILTTEGEVLIVDIEPGSETENFVVARVSGGSTVKSIAMKPDGLLLYLIQEESDIILVVLVEVMDAMSVIDPDIVFPPKTVEVSIIDSLYAGEDPAFLVFDPTGTGVAYVTNTGPQTVTVVNTSEIPVIMAILSVPEDRTVYIWPILQYVQLDGFTITNGSISAPMFWRPSASRPSARARMIRPTLDRHRCWRPVNPIGFPALGCTCRARKCSRWVERSNWCTISWRAMISRAIRIRAP